MAFVDTAFSRGTGLGNRLFPWARSRIFACTYGTQSIASDWAHIRRGPLLAGGINYFHFARKVWLFDNFVPAPNDIQGWMKYRIRQKTTSISETDLYHTPNLMENQRVIFTGDGQHFADLYPNHSIVTDALYAIVAPKWKTYLNAMEGAEVGLNVRLGRDFKKAVQPEDFFQKGALLTPVQWFVQSLELIRKILGRSCSTIVISDGTSEELQPLLAMKDVHFLNTPAAVTDLLALSKVKFMVGSGGSSFSAWASFLGKVPMVSHPGQSAAWFKLDQQDEFLVDTLNLTEPSDDVIRAVKKTLGNGKGTYVH